MSGHRKGVCSNENETSTALPSKYTQFSDFKLKQNPRCTKQWSPNGVFLHATDWLWKSKSIMEYANSYSLFYFSFRKSHLFILSTLGSFNSEEREEKEKC